MNQQPQQQIQIKADDATAKGYYANLMQVAHTKEEFALDFLNAMPPQGALVSRIFVSPGHMKRIVNALGENIRNYEEKFGKIEEAKGPEEMGFKTE